MVVKKSSVILIGKNRQPSLGENAYVCTFMKVSHVTRIEGLDMMEIES